jgi:hypothetical protein
MAQAGCGWGQAGNSTECTGTSTCANFTDQASCTTGHDNCFWSTGVTNCSGTPTPCAQLTVNTCSTQPGCTVQ